MTLNPKGLRVGSDDEEDDINPFQREETSGDFKEIDEQHINIDSKGVPSSDPEMFGKLKAVETLPVPASQVTKNLREPEPEQTVFSDEESKSSAQKGQPSSVSNLGRLSNSVNNQTSEGTDDIQEELDDGGDYSQEEFEEYEEKAIAQMRRDEVRKSVFKKDEERLQTYLNQQKSKLQHAVNLTKSIFVVTVLEQ